ncbi:MAG: hypothetical protein H6510_16075 [Acidobacteria bacterium]|nr:hypothetical protein [Acidobacteriota bacterium]MCB9399331.1 hypothetical protein [Acidobacteriota bacterium]
MLFIIFSGLAFGQNIIFTTVYEETTGNLPGPFSGMSIPIGVWHLLQYTGGWGGNNPPPPPPPNGCTAGGNSTMVWDEILMFENIGSPNFVAMPSRGRWGNYFSGAVVATRAPGERWSNPVLLAQSNGGNWESFSSQIIQATGETVAVIGDYSSHPENNTGTLTLRGALRMQCGSQSPYLVSQTYSLTMLDPDEEVLGDYIGGGPYTRLSSLEIGYKGTQPSYQWPMPYEHIEPNFLEGAVQRLTIQEIAVLAAPGITIYPESVIPEGTLIGLPSGIYPIFLHRDRSVKRFSFYKPNWLGEADTTQPYYLGVVQCFLSVGPPHP